MHLNFSGALCGDADALAAIDRYEFDAHEPAFLTYCERRGVLYKAGAPGTPRYAFTMETDRGESEFMAMPYFQQSAQGYSYGPEEMQTHWRILCIARGALQNAWQVYRTHNAAHLVPAECADLFTV